MRRWPISRNWIVYCAHAALAEFADATSFATSTRPSPSPKIQTSPTPISTSTQSSGDRDSAFQVLSDGTQDLAALVGLFATDSVERYAFDHTKGFLLPSLATCSLLGLLGYVRALLKLSLGPQACEDAGFSVQQLRPYFGVSRSEVVGSEMITEVVYLRREAVVKEGKEEMVEWRIESVKSHTSHSMPITGLVKSRKLQEKKPMCYNIYGLAASSSWNPYNSLGLSRILPCDKIPTPVALGAFISLLFFTGLTSFIIFALPPFHVHTGWPWTRYFATFGLFIPVLVASSSWAWAFRMEQTPHGSYPWSTRHPASVKQHFSSTGKGEGFMAFIQDPSFTQTIAFDSGGLTSSTLLLLRGISGLAAVCISISYVCQYIELRRLNATASGIWLGIQAALALLRVLLWIAQPAFQRYVVDEDDVVEDWRVNDISTFAETDLVLLWFAKGGFDEREGVEVFVPRDPTEVNYRDRGRLRIPVWVAKALQTLDLKEAFSLARRIREDEATDAEIDELVGRGIRQWVFPGRVFEMLLGSRLKLEVKSAGGGANKTRQEIFSVPAVRHTPYTHYPLNAARCRIIESADGRIHLLPGVVLKDQGLGVEWTVYRSGEGVEALFTAVEFLKNPKDGGLDGEELMRGLQGLKTDELKAGFETVVTEIEGWCLFADMWTAVEVCSMTDEEIVGLLPGMTDPLFMGWSDDQG